MSKYSEKKERQSRQLAKETVARDEYKADLKVEEGNFVADKVRSKNRLVEILALFSDAESSLSKAYSALANIRLQSSGSMSVFLKELDFNSLFAMEKTNSAIVKTNVLITILDNQM